eukprot:scaffold18575_cov104-Isochrysis_galbana.AAC.3
MGSSAQMPFSQASSARNGWWHAYLQKTSCALPSIPEMGRVQMLNGSSSPTTLIGKRPTIRKKQIIDSILERECAVRDLLLDLQEDDNLVDAALQTLGKRMAAFQHFTSSTSTSNGLAIGQGPCLNRVSVCASGGHCS